MSKSMSLIFDPSRSSKVKPDGANQKPMGPKYKCSQGPTLYLSLFFLDISSQNFDNDLLTLVRLTPGPKFTKRGSDLLPTQVYHPAKSHRPPSTHSRGIPYKISCRRTNKHRNRKRYIPTCLLARGDNNNKENNDQRVYPRGEQTPHAATVKNQSQMSPKSNYFEAAP